MNADTMLRKVRSALRLENNGLAGQLLLAVFDRVLKLWKLAE